MRFDTRNKKPHIWNIAGLAVLTAGVLAVLALGGAEKNVLPISVVFAVFLFLSILLLLRAFRGQLQYNPYSYNTVYYMGFALFLVSVLVNHLILTVHFALEPETHAGQNVNQILALLNGSARTYMLVTSPFVLAISIALCIANIALIRHEGKRFVNLLGIILAFLLVGGELLFVTSDFAVSGSVNEIMMHELFINVYAAGYLYFECMMIGLMAANRITAGYQPEYNKDYMIILGCGIRKDGTPSPLLRGRIDRAVAFRREQLEKTGKDLVFVTSGGQGANEVISESEAMKRYLITVGIPEDHILEEDRSTNTYENMKFSKAKIMERDPGARIAFSTSDYHVFRSGLFARRVKMRAVGIGAKSKWYFWPNALVREFVGLLTEHRGKQVLVLGGMILIYVILTFSAVS